MDVNWNDDEAVVKAVWDDAKIRPGATFGTWFVVYRPGVILSGCRLSAERAWHEARKHPTVKYFEFSHNPDFASADLDARAEEQRVREATGTIYSDDVCKSCGHDRDDHARWHGYCGAADVVNEEAIECQCDDFDEGELAPSTTLPALPVAPENAKPSISPQQMVADWCLAAFGAEHASSIEQRGLRMLEEAVETAQAAGVNLAQAHALMDFVYSRPVGEISQEIGGLRLTTLALAAAATVDAEEAEATEIARVLSKPLDYFKARNEAKNKAGFVAAHIGREGR